MKKNKMILLLLSFILFFSGCNIHIKPIVPEEQGSVFDWFKKEPPPLVTEDEKEDEKENEKENEEIEAPKEDEKTIEEDEKEPEIQRPEDSTEDNEDDEQPELDETETNNEEAKSLLSVSVVPQNPDKDGYITLNVNGPANTPYTATFYFRTRESQIKGYCEIPFQVLLGGATIGYEVKVEVTALINGQVHKATASFTPK